MHIHTYIWTHSLLQVSLGGLGGVKEVGAECKIMGAKEEPDSHFSSWLQDGFTEVKRSKTVAAINVLSDFCRIKGSWSTPTS